MRTGCQIQELCFNGVVACPWYVRLPAQLLTQGQTPSCCASLQDITEVQVSCGVAPEQSQQRHTPMFAKKQLLVFTSQTVCCIAMCTDGLVPQWALTK